MIIERPRGVVPRARGCGLGPEYAEVAENMRLTGGRFEPWRQPARVLEFTQRVCHAHVRDCCWLGTSVPRSRYVDAGLPVKTYLSAPGQRAVVTDSVCHQDWSFLGYPVPDAAVAYSNLGVDFTPDTQLRTYRITYGTDCEEGPASPVSNAIKALKDSPVGIELPPPPEETWGATVVNIYRSEALWDSEQGLLSFNPDDLNTGWHSTATEEDWFHVATLPVGTTHWIDDKFVETDRLLRTADLLPLPEGVTIAGETQSGSLVGYSCTDVFFSERNKYWGFPYRAIHSFPHDIVDVQVVGDTVFVLTDSHPYLISDAVDCKDSSARPVTEVSERLPAIGHASSVVVNGGVLYTSEEGLVFLSPGGSATMSSQRAFEKDDWTTLDPRKIHLGTGCDHLFVSVSGGPTLVWELSFDESGYLPADVTTLSFTPSQWINDERGTLYMLSESVAYEFHVGDYLQMVWRQIPQRSTYKEVVSAIRGEYVKKKGVDFNTLSVYKEGALSAVRKLTPRGSRIRGSAAYCTQLELKGSEPMCWIAAGSGLNELERRPT